MARAPCASGGVVVEFCGDATLGASPEQLWKVLSDYRVVVACVPGCQTAEELAPLARYRALMKQQLGPFRLSVPLDLEFTSNQEGRSISVKATGRDPMTGTSVSAHASIGLAAGEGDSTRLTVNVTLNIGGRLATLGHSVVRQRASSNFEEFSRRLRAVLEKA